MNNKDPGQPVHRHSLISVFGIRLLESTKSILFNEGNFTFLASLCSCGDWFESCFVGNPHDRFSHVVAHILYQE